MIKPVLFLFFIFLSLTLLQGCALFTKAPQLLTLKRLGDSQKQMELDVEAKKKNLEKLIKDIEADKLERGLSFKKFISRYGEPVLEKEVKKGGRMKKLLYRHPVEYFNTDKVYLYFDSNLELAAWKYEKKQEKASQ